MVCTLSPNLFGTREIGLSCSVASHTRPERKTHRVGKICDGCMSRRIETSAANAHVETREMYDVGAWIHEAVLTL